MRQRSQEVGGKGKRGLKRIDTLAGENRSEFKHYSNYNKLACASKHLDNLLGGHGYRCEYAACSVYMNRTEWLDREHVDVYKYGVFRMEHGMRDAAKMVGEGVVVGCGGPGRGASRTYL